MYPASILYVCCFIQWFYKPTTPGSDGEVHDPPETRNRLQPNTYHSVWILGIEYNEVFFFTCLLDWFFLFDHSLPDML